MPQGPDNTQKWISLLLQSSDVTEMHIATAIEAMHAKVALERSTSSLSLSTKECKTMAAAALSQMDRDTWTRVTSEEEIFDFEKVAETLPSRKGLVVGEGGGGHLLAAAVVPSRGICFVTPSIEAEARDLASALLHRWIPTGDKRHSVQKKCIDRICHVVVDLMTVLYAERMISIRKVRCATKKCKNPPSRLGNIMRLNLSIRNEKVANKERRSTCMRQYQSQWGSAISGLPSCVHHGHLWFRKGDLICRLPERVQGVGVSMDTIISKLFDLGPHQHHCMDAGGGMASQNQEDTSVASSQEIAKAQKITSALVTPDVLRKHLVAYCTDLRALGGSDGEVEGVGIYTPFPELMREALQKRPLVSSLYQMDPGQPESQPEDQVTDHATEQPKDQATDHPEEQVTDHPVDHPEDQSKDQPPQDLSSYIAIPVGSDGCVVMMASSTKYTIGRKIRECIGKSLHAEDSLKCGSCGSGWPPDYDFVAYGLADPCAGMQLICCNCQRQERSTQCPTTHAAYQVNHSEKDVVGQCADCARKVTPHNRSTFEWDHEHPSTKTANVGNMVRRGADAHQIREEIAKCTLRCVSCHSLRTSMQWKLPSDDPRAITRRKRKRAHPQASQAT